MKHRETSGPKVGCAPASPAVETMDDREAVHLAEALDLAAHLVALHKGIPLEVKLTRLSPEVADVLKGHNGELSVTGLKNLCSEAAQHLCQHPLLRLDIRHLDFTDHLAGVLATHKGVLWLDGLETLLSTKAEVLGAQNGSVHVADEKQTEPPGTNGRLHLAEALDLAAHLVALHKGIPLEVKLTRLSPEVAAVLKGHNGELSVTGLKELRSEAAQHLCRHSALRLDFRHMTLTDELAGVLASHQGILWLDGLQLLPSAKADVLSTRADVQIAHNGPVLVADETNIEPEADERLQKCAFQAPILEKGLDLAGAPLRVQRMTTSLAEALVFFREGWLLLDALEKLSVDHALLLGARSGRISLNGLEEVSPQVVAKLVAHAIAMPGSYIPSLIDDSSPSQRARRRLTSRRLRAPQTRHLRLNGLSHLRIEVAREFNYFRGILELNGIRTLEAEAARCLATVEGEVHLKGLEDLDEETIRVLSPRQHILRLSPQLAKKFTK